MIRVRPYGVLALALAGCAAGSGGMPVLMYSDQSAGSLMDSSASRHAEAAQDNAVVFTTDPTEFAAQIPARAWAKVFVFVQYAAEEPPYLPALRAFAAAQPSAVIYMELWHPAGYTIRADILVKATLAQVVWVEGLTVITYRNAQDGQGAKPGEADSWHGMGQIWPKFGGIVPRKPEAIIKLPPGALPDRDTFDLLDFLRQRERAADDDWDDAWLHASPAEQAAWQAFAAEIAECRQVHATNPARRLAGYGLATARLHAALRVASAQDGH